MPSLPAAGRARRRPSRVTVVAAVALVLYLLFPALLTLGSTPTASFNAVDRALADLAQSLDLAETATPSRRQLEALANVLLFIPVGLLLPLAVPRAYLSVLLVVAVLGSVGIELAQLLVLTGRVPTLQDVVMNTLGAALGLVAGADGRRLVRR